MTALVLGLLVGVAAGALMASERLCFNSAVREGLIERSPHLLRVFAIAIAAQMPMLALLTALGFDLTAIGFFPVAQLIGGLLFGTGMALAGGCIIGILWKAGTGALALALAIAGFVVGELLIRGPAEGVRAELDAAGPAPANRTLYEAVGLSYELTAAVVGCALLAALLARSRDGLAIGLAFAAVSVAAWLAGSLADYGYGLGFVGVADDTRSLLAGGDLGGLPFPLWVAVGIVAGAALVVRGPLRLPDRARATRAVGGGLLMGFGGTLAHGCNIGNGLTGVPVLSLGSIWALAWMVAGVLITWRLVLAGRPGWRGTERARAATG